MDRQLLSDKYLTTAFTIAGGQIRIGQYLRTLIVDSTTGQRPATYKLFKTGMTLVLDFQTTETTLLIEKDPGQVYDNSTKHYSTKTTSGKTTMTYDTYALANILTIVLNGQYYNIGTIDGASDMPVLGLTFNYCNEQTVEFLTLFATKPLELTTIRHIMRTQKVNYPDAKKIAKTLVLLPGSTLLMTIKN